MGTIVSGNARVTTICTKTPLVISGLDYLVTVTDNHVKVGRRCFTLEEWETISGEEHSNLGGEKASKFYKSWGEVIKLAAKNHIVKQ